MLPYMSDKSIMRPMVQRGFGGLNHNLSAADGEIWDMQNMSSREYPLLRPRKARGLVYTKYDPHGAGSLDKIFYVDGTSFVYGTEVRGTVEDSEKVFACIGTKVLIWPDKKFYDVESNTFGSLELETTVTSLQFINGTYAGVAAEANTLYKASVGWQFSEGDAVTISGCVTHPENNGTFIIREVDGDYLRFYENTFVLDTILRYTAPAEGLAAGNYYFRPDENSVYSFTLASALSEDDTLTWNGTSITAVIGGVTSTISVTSGETGDPLEFAEIPVNYTESSVKIKRSLPDMDYICSNENRVWGCKGDTIYASKLGDPFNWNVFDGLATDSWSVDVGDAGDFTGCIGFQGHPTFFKEDKIYKIQGDTPQNFALNSADRFGVKSGSYRSLVIVGETLFYLSRVGVCAYTGGSPQIISAPLGVNAVLKDGVAGTEGLRYYLSVSVDNYYGLYVYDTRYGVWHKEDSTQANCFGMNGDGDLWMFDASGNVWALGAKLGAEESSVAWAVEFADIYRYYETTNTKSQDKKGLLRLQLRCELPYGSTLSVYVKYDSSGDWEELAEETGVDGVKRTYVVPMILRRCDHYRLKLTGSGDCVIYSLTETQYAGSPFPASTVPTASVQ